MATLAEHYGWPHDYWRTMGYATFWSWLAARNRSERRRVQAGQASPTSWAGRQADPFWQAQDQLRARRRGR